MMPRIQCPSCGDIQARSWYSARRSDTKAGCYGSRRLGVPNPHGALYLCPQCGWGMQHPLPQSSELQSLYHGLSEQSYLEDASTRMMQFERELITLRRLHGKEGASLLDFGCSYGLMLDAARNHDMNAVGLELGTQQVAHCLNRGLDVRLGGLEKLEPEEQFDFIIAWDVLEHVLDPLDTLRSLRDHMNKMGIISLVVPDRGSHIARLLGERWWSILDLHLHYPTRSGMKNVLKQSGFDVMEISTHPKLASPRLLIEWIPFRRLRSMLSPLIRGSWHLTIDPRDQMRIHARAV